MNEPKPADLNEVYRIAHVGIAHELAIVEAPYRELAKTVSEDDVADYYRNRGRQVVDYLMTNSRINGVEWTRAERPQREKISIKPQRDQLDQKYGKDVWVRNEMLTKIRQRARNIGERALSKTEAEAKLDSIAEKQMNHNRLYELYNADVYDEVAITEPGQPIYRKDLQGHVMDTIVALGESVYMDACDNDPYFTPGGGMWLRGEENIFKNASGVADVLTEKFHGTLSDLTFTNLPIDEEWIDSYFAHQAPDTDMDRENIKRMRLGLGLNKHRKTSALTSQVEIVMYRLRNNKKGDKIVMTNRKTDRLNVTAHAIQQNEDSAHRASMIEAANLASPLQGGLPSLGRRSK